MGTNYRKIFGIVFISLFALFSLAGWSVKAQKVSGADKIKVTRIKVPVYQEGRDIPIIILTSEEAKPLGVRFEMKGVKLVWLGDTMKDIKGTVETSLAVYDRSSKTVTGNEKITYRSKEVDIDGVGFDIDHEKQTLHIRSKVKVTLKGDLSSVKQLRQSKKPVKKGALSLVPTTKKAKEKSPASNKLKSLLNDMIIKKPTKEKAKNEKQ